ncbi:hypothetical protein TNCV_2832081 [Trichonephila clavipes]|nr:hypothetical protein TNCV_2832081 [Trichonephila clavipes]
MGRCGTKLNCIVTEYEPLCHRYKQETKRQNMEWHSPASSRRKKVRAEKSPMKMMFIILLDSQGIIPVFLKLWGAPT